MVFRGIGRNDRRCLRKSVTLEDRNTYRIVVFLEVDSKKRASADEEFHPVAESGLADALKENLVKEFHERQSPEVLATLVVAFLIVCYGVAHCKVIKFLNLRPLCLNTGFDCLLEILGKRRNREHHGRTGFLNCHRDVSERLHRRASLRNRGD